MTLEGQIFVVSWSHI